MSNTIFRFPNFLTSYRIVRRRRRRRTLRSRSKTYLKHKEMAREVVMQKLREHNLHYGFTWQRVAIRNQHSRWGSCSEKGNLNFHYRIAFLPPPLLDYIIIHELCHLKLFNHSKAFWDLVAERVPDHKARRKSLQKIRFSITLP